MWESLTNDAHCPDYADPVGRLLTAGETNLYSADAWPDYPAKYELGHEHVPALIRMACDMTLHTGDPDQPEIWAPVHAWRTLAQLRAVEAIESLLEFMKIDLDDDAVAQEFSTVFGMIGPAAIPSIAAFLQDRTVGWLPASIASGGLKEIVDRHPECRDECVGILVRALEHAADTDPTANGFTIGSLLDLSGVEAIATIRDAFRRDTVDISIAGDLEDVEIELGLRQRRSTPRPYYPFASKEFGSTKFRSGVAFEDISEDVGVMHRPVKIGRNEPCPCGSGKKYKKCCLG
jgi:hypothetical protein